MRMRVCTELGLLERWLQVVCSPRVAHQECHLGSGDRLGGDYKITLIFTVWRVQDDYEFAVFWFIARLVIPEWLPSILAENTQSESKEQLKLETH